MALTRRRITSSVVVFDGTRPTVNHVLRDFVAQNRVPRAESVR